MIHQLCKSLIRPHLEYAGLLWNPTLKRDVLMLENIQRRATCMVCELKKTLLIKRDARLRFEFPSLQYRRKRKDMIQVYKIINRIDDIPQ